MTATAIGAVLHRVPKLVSIDDPRVASAISELNIANCGRFSNIPGFVFHPAVLSGMSAFERRVLLASLARYLNLPTVAAGRLVALDDVP
eukprot:CAMPEP_0174876418 /NCGR_PEP_ID=MMETSP1114-20130205/80130_1 /TAXON_ID=312471 /ORGANISM="Neobodo designis, Strain CCAP 1951/1" /LENGTH=88 /DNA_ID=CAMNT_0016111793 /DNA_START=21 /DNA_END=283 /DNA_ORIENTATION=-